MTPLVCVVVECGVADVTPVGDVDVLHVDLDIIDSNADAADLRRWIRETGAALDTGGIRVPADVRTWLEDSLRKAQENVYAIAAARFFQRHRRRRVFHFQPYGPRGPVFSARRGHLDEDLRTRRALR